MHRTLVLNVVGLTPALMGEHTPRLASLASAGAAVPLRTIAPAVTCSVQSTFTTGTLPAEHGCVGNGWYFRDLSQIWLWRQSSHLVHGERIWEAGTRRNPAFTCAKLFWWYNMYSTATWSVTPRPIYRADGIKLPDIYSHPIALRDELQRGLGTFPLFEFWGPKAGIRSSRWIADCAEWVEKKHEPTLSLVYLPHLDYDLQRFGPADARVARALRDIDDVCGSLLELADRRNLRVIVLSEYGIVGVKTPVHINRVLRAAGLVAYREECGEEHLDPGASAAFAVADHQVAHVYVRDPQRIPEVRRLLEAQPGIETVLDEEGKRAIGLHHPRSGELVAVAAADAWFTYYWWLDDARAPDFARTVDIHAKPGYDPAELFVDPGLGLPSAYVAARLLQRKLLKQRVLLDVVPLDATLVRGSHGRLTARDDEGPVFMTSQPRLLGADRVAATEVKQLILDHVFVD